MKRRSAYGPYGSGRTLRFFCFTCISRRKCFDRVNGWCGSRRCSSWPEVSLGRFHVSRRYQEARSNTKPGRVHRASHRWAWPSIKLFLPGKLLLVCITVSLAGMEVRPTSRLATSKLATYVRPLAKCCRRERLVGK